MTKKIRSLREIRSLAARAVWALVTRREGSVGVCVHGARGRCVELAMVLNRAPPLRVLPKRSTDPSPLVLSLSNRFRSR
jgi:hypothetical protein